MSLEPKEQLKKFLENSKEILILISENPSADAVGSAWALYHFLEKKKIAPTIAFSNHLSSKFTFLPKPERIVNEISGARDLILSFDVSKNNITNIRHERIDGKVNIHITPERGAINPKDFSFILAKYKYDLVIVIACSDLEKLGALYVKNPDLFFEVPVVNIDCKSENDNFGQINLIDVTASSCSEIVRQAMEAIDPSFVDKNVATCLLTGIIGATNSFQDKNTTPRAFAAAARLMDQGADQQEIIRWLYKTHPLHVLKLWGRAMAKINWENETKLAWSAISVEDFVQSRASAQDLPLILDELEENYNDGQIFLTLYNDTPESSIAIIKTREKELLKKILPLFGGEIRHGLLEFKIEESDMLQAGQKIAEKMRQTMKKE